MTALFKRLYNLVWYKPETEKEKWHSDGFYTGFITAVILFALVVGGLKALEMSS